MSSSTARPVLDASSSCVASCAASPKPLDLDIDRHYALPSDAQRKIVILTGDINVVLGEEVTAHVVTSLEGTNSQLARFYEASVSGAFRYLDAEKSVAVRYAETPCRKALTSACARSQSTRQLSPARWSPRCKESSVTATDATRDTRRLHSGCLGVVHQAVTTRGSRESRVADARCGKEGRAARGRRYQALPRYQAWNAQGEQLVNGLPHHAAGITPRYDPSDRGDHGP